MENQAVSQEVALEELRGFVKQYTRKTKTDEELQNEYPDVVCAIENGELKLDTEIPTLKLVNPIKNDEGENSISEVIFKTRLLPSEQRKAAKGVDVKADSFLFVHKCMAEIIKQPYTILDKFSKSDYKVIEQLSSLFM